MVTKSKGLIKQTFTFFEKFDKKRGSIIGLAIQLEDYLTNFITWCVFPNKFDKGTTPDVLIDNNGIALKSLLLNKITFRDKIEILQEIIEFRNKEIFERNKKFIKNTVKELNEVRVFRNMIAHLESQISFDIPISSNNTLEDCIQIIDFKHGKEQTYIIDRAKYELESNRIKEAISHLHDLFNLFSSDPKIVKNYQNSIDRMRSPQKRQSFKPIVSKKLNIIV